MYSILISIKTSFIHVSILCLASKNTPTHLRCTLPTSFTGVNSLLFGTWLGISTLFVSASLVLCYGGSVQDSISMSSKTWKTCPLPVFCPVFSGSSMLSYWFPLLVPYSQCCDIPRFSVSSQTMSVLHFLLFSPKSTKTLSSFLCCLRPPPATLISAVMPSVALL